MKRELRGSAVVITGATSGAGRATALAFARRGARTALAARDAAALDDVAAACDALGADSIAVPTDITDADAIDRLAESALQRFGAIDTWVNVAGALVAGALDQTAIADLDRLIATNVRGSMLANRRALACFRQQRSGVIINVSSILGVVPNPVVPAYTMSKFAVRGLSLCLHHTPGLPGVRVCTVLPGPLDTPMFDSAANYSGKQLRSVPPSCAPERAAAAIVACARRPRRQVVVGWTGRLVMLGSRVWPGFTERAVALYSGRFLLRPTPAPDSSGDLYAPHGERRIDGEWRRNATRRRLGAAVGRGLARRA
jgi:NAD(P)-dependent dehydrogenase (short-subunit alcohol dehydrogenase family)